MEQDILVAGAMREVSGRKVAEDQFRHSDEVFHIIVNNIKDYGIIMLDPEGLIVTWNAGSQAISGYRANEVIGKTLFPFLPIDRHSTWQARAGTCHRQIDRPECGGRLAAAKGRYGVLGGCGGDRILRDPSGEASPVSSRLPAT